MARSDETEELTKRLFPILRGQDPEVIGAALGVCVANYVAGHAPELRQETLELFIRLVRGLIPILSKEALDTGLHPKEWTPQ